jgi:large subunit ribosomal protein L19
MSSIITEIEKESLKKDVPDFRSGDTVSVNIKVKEGDKERIQVFTGTVIQRRASGLGESFTVRKMSSGIGVERIFLLHSPNVESIKIVRRGIVRRARIFYMRERQGKAARIKERIKTKVS